MCVCVVVCLGASHIHSNFLTEWWALDMRPVREGEREKTEKTRNSTHNIHTTERKKNGFNCEFCDCDCSLWPLWPCVPERRSDFLFSYIRRASFFYEDEEPQYGMAIDSWSGQQHRTHTAHITASTTTRRIERHSANVLHRVHIDSVCPENTHTHPINNAPKWQFKLVPTSP